MYCEAKDAEGDLKKYKVDRESDESDILPDPLISFIRKVFKGKTYLLVGCREQLLGGERKGYYIHSGTKEEKLFTKDPQFTQ